MPDYVSVNADRLQQLAAALKDAAALVPDRKTSMRSAIQGWEGEWNVSALESLATFLESNYKGMEDRADLARTAEHQAVVTSPGDPKASWRSIPWDITPEVLAQEGLTDARNISSRLDSDDEEAQAQAREELAFAMEAHADDAAWMQAFISNGGAAAINTASVQTLSDHIPLDEGQQARMSSYAQGLAAATRMSEAGDIAVPADAFDVFAEGDNVVATGIMTKFGPSGDQYGSRFLAGVGQAAIDWRKDNDENRPSYSEGQVTSGGYSPGGYSYDRDHAWWAKLGVDIFYVHTNAEDAANGIEVIRGYDPSTNILNIVGDNQAASQALLTGDKGADNAHELVSNQWQTPPGMDDSAPIAKLITTATEDRSGPAAEASARAALNLMDAASDLYDDRDDRSDFDKEQYPEVPPQLARGLSQMASGYAVDMAKSTVQSDPDANGVVKDKDGHWVIQTNTTTMNGLMGTFMTDPQAAGSYQGSVDSLLRAAAAGTVKFPDEATDLLRQTGYLKGMTEISLSTQGFDEAEAKDAANKRAETMTDAVTGIVGSLPLGDAAGFIFGAGDAIRGAAGDSLFPQDAADDYTSAAQFNINQGANDMRTFVAQGFADGGAYPLPDDASFVHNGVIAPQNADEQAAFDNWYADMPDDLANTDDARDGYTDAAQEYAPNDDKFKDPK